MVDAKDQSEKSPAQPPFEDQLSETGDAPAGEADFQTSAADVVEAAEEPALAERLAEAEREIARIKDDFLRALAETENVRRRAARDKIDASKYAIAGFARDLLPVADNLRRAADSVDAEARERDPALQALVTGVEMTEKELLGVLARHGITPIEAEGKRFDPHVHEAMFEIPDESVPHGTVVQVVERGFMIHDRPLRPSRVGVSRGGPKESPAQSPQSEGDSATRGEVPFMAGDASAFEQKGPYEQKSEPQGPGSGSRYDEKL